MGKLAILAVFTACGWAAQMATPEQIQRESLRGMRGDAAREQRREQIARPAARAPSGPAGETVSVARLRHKPPPKARKALTRALAFSRAGKSGEAEAELRQALAWDPEFSDAHTQLGIHYTQLRRYADAEKELRASVVLDPDSWSGHYNLALLLATAAKFADAEQSAARALRLSPGNADAQRLLTWLRTRPAPAE